MATSRVRHRARARVQEGQGEEMRATLVLCFGCLTRDAATERIFLIIHNSRIFHPNNLKFWKKLLCTNMNNFLAKSSLYVKLPPILLLHVWHGAAAAVGLLFCLLPFLVSTCLLLLGLRSRRSPWCPLVHLKPFNDAG